MSGGNLERVLRLMAEKKAIRRSTRSRRSEEHTSELQSQR